jgi:hypothetical protein
MDLTYMEMGRPPLSDASLHKRLSHRIGRSVKSAAFWPFGLESAARTATNCWNIEVFRVKLQLTWRLPSLRRAGWRKPHRAKFDRADAQSAQSVILG